MTRRTKSRRGPHGVWSALFVPSQIAGLRYWLDGERQITLETGVKLWGDRSVGTAHDFAQATVADQPAYIAGDAAFNGHGSVKGDGVSDYLETPAHADLGPGTGFEWICVFRQPATAATMYLMRRTNAMLVAVLSTGKCLASLRNSANTAWVAAYTTGVIDDDVARIARVRWDGSTWSFTVGGETVSVSAPDANAPLNPTALLATPTPNKWSSAAIPVVLRYDHALTTPEWSQLSAWLTRRYIP